MGHWYEKGTGEPRYTVKGANGRERDTTLSDAKKLKLLPSCTTIIGQLDKYWLNKWKIEQAVEFSHRYRDINDLETYKERVLRDFEIHGMQYSQRGTEIHDALEVYFKENKIVSEDESWIIPAIEKIQSLDFDLYEAEPSFASAEGYGGKIDLILRNSKTAIMDFKSKNKDELSDKLIGWDYIMQLAAYREAIDPTAECYNLLISTTKPGTVHLYKHKEEDLQQGMKMFRSLLQYWKVANNYDPCEVI